MSGTDTIEKAKLGAEKAKEAADFIHEYSEAARKLSEEGKELSKLQSVAATLEGFDKLSTGFMMAGAGLEVATMFMGGAEDPNAQILNALQELDDKVTGMWQDMDKRLDDLKKEMIADKVEEEIYNSVERMAGLKREVLLYQKDHQNDDLTDPPYNPGFTNDAFIKIADAFITNKSDSNPLASKYDAEYGSASVISERIRTYLDIALFAPMAYSLSSALQHAKDGKELHSPEDVQYLFGKGCKDIIASCAHFAKRLADEEDKNIKDRIANKLTGKIKLKISRTDTNEVDIDDADPNPGRNPFHVPTQAMLDDLVQNWPGVSFWVVIGQKYLNHNWNFVQEGGVFDGTNYFDPSVKHLGGNPSVSVFWTRAPGDPPGRATMQQIFDHGYTEYWYYAAEDTLGSFTLKDEVRSRGLAGAINYLSGVRTDSNYAGDLDDDQICHFDWSKIQGGTGNHKNISWAMRSNAYNRTALWLYPTWNPLNIETMSEETPPKFNLPRDEGKSDALVRVTKTGDSGVVFVLIW
jgi:hypothetical protein